MRFWRRKFESEMDLELGFHIDAYVEDLIHSGVARNEAERLARLEFGSIAATKDECRLAWGLQWMDELRADVRLTLRTFRRNPGFAAIAVLSLALGIGANTAIFGLAEAIMLRTLPVHDVGRLVFVHTAGLAGRDGPPYPFFELIRDQAQSFDALAAFSASNMEIIIDRTREQTRGIWVSGNFYQMLGVTPVIGRTLAASDDQTAGKGGPDGAVAVISQAYWQQRFQGDPAVLGRTVRMRFDVERTVTIVGVMPSEIMSVDPGRPIDIAVPMVLSDPAKLHDRSALWLFVIARLKPGVPAEQALGESNSIFHSYMADVRIPPEVRKQLYDHVELKSAAKGLGVLRIQFSDSLTAMMLLAGLVLLAACVNVANLMLARGTARQKEFAVRLAIGAGRGRLVRQTLTEAMVLVISGAALGILFAQQGKTALAAFFASGRNQIVIDLSLNGRMLLFTLALTVLTGLAFGILPALRASRVDAGVGLQSGSRSIVGSRSSLRIGRSLVITQVALSTVLLAGAGLFIRSLRQLEAVNPGFSREGVLTMEITPEREMIGTSGWLSDQADVLNSVSRISGIQSVSWGTLSPFSGRGRAAILEIQGFTPRSERDREVRLAAVSPAYFETFGIGLMLGRAFTPGDNAAAAKVGILSETAARFYFGKANPLGRKVRFANYPDPGLVYEVIGVVRDIKYDSLREQPYRTIYLPIPQSVDRINRLALSLRCVGDPITFAPTVKREVQSIRSTILINNISTMENQVSQSLRTERLITTLSTAFGMLALALACIGLYGILTYSVSRRTSEIGIRMALGATRGEMVWLILREAVVLAVGGILVGGPTVVAVGHISRSLLYGVEQFDTVAFAGALIVLVACAALAGLVPALRAGRLHPLSALRCE